MAVMNAQYKHPESAYSQGLRDLIDSMLKANPSDRPDIHQVRTVLFPCLRTHGADIWASGFSNDRARSKVLELIIVAKTRLCFTTISQGCLHIHWTSESLYFNFILVVCSPLSSVSVTL